MLNLNWRSSTTRFAAVSRTFLLVFVVGSGIGGGNITAAALSRCIHLLGHVAFLCGGVEWRGTLTANVIVGGSLRGGQLMCGRRIIISGGKAGVEGARGGVSIHLWIQRT